MCIVIGKQLHNIMGGEAKEICLHCKIECTYVCFECFFSIRDFNFVDGLQADIYCFWYAKLWRTVLDHCKLKIILLNKVIALMLFVINYTLNYSYGDHSDYYTTKYLQTWFQIKQTPFDPKLFIGCCTN